MGGVMLTLAELEALETLYEATNKDEWQGGMAGPCNIVAFGGDDITGMATATYPNHPFIIAAHNSFPALIRSARLSARLGLTEESVADIMTLRNIEITGDWAPPAELCDHRIWVDEKCTNCGTGGC